MRNFNKILLLLVPFWIGLSMCNGQDSVFVYNLDKSKIYYSIDSATIYVELYGDAGEDEKNEFIAEMSSYSDEKIIVDNIYRLHIDDTNLRGEFMNKALADPVVDNVSFCYLGDKNNDREKAWTYHAILLKVRGPLDGILSQMELYPLQTETISVSDFVYKIVLAKDVDVFSVAQSLAEQEDVVYASPLFYRSSLQCSYGDNPEFSNQWYLDSSTDADINVLKAWLFTTGDSSIVIGIIDDGINLGHPDLHNNVLLGKDFTPSGCPTGQSIPSRREVHGTKCTGILAAENNSVGMVGVAHTSKVMPLKAFYGVTRDINPPTENGCITSDEYLIRAIYYACDTVHVDVLNCSWGGMVENTSLSSAIHHATIHGRNGKGIIVCASVGNKGYSQIKFPARLDDVLGVGAVDQDTFRAYNIILSQYGDGLNLVALGEGIRTIVNDTAYDDVHGTSFAAPQVAATAALILSLDSTLTYQDVFEIICSSTTKPRVDEYPFAYYDNYPYGTWNEELGYGLLNVHHALLKTMYRNCRVVCPDTVFICRNQTVSLENFPSFPDSITFCWSTSPNLDWTIETDSSITVWGNEVGSGWVAFNIIHAGDTMPIQRPVFIAHSFSVVDTLLGVSDSITHPSLILGDLFIDSTRTLVVSDTLHCAPSSRIIVRPGGKLIVDGGTLTNSCTGEMWQGIYVEGHSNLHQTEANQGKVVLKNGAVIENALCGIRTGAPGDTSNTSTGGIVHASDATFRNCAKSVAFFPYADTVSGTTIRNNFSGFSNCTFTIDDNNLFAANDTSFDTHAYLWDVRGVSFEGCTFNNATTAMTYDRGYAIKAEDAGFSISTLCDTVYTEPTTDCQCPADKATHSQFGGFLTAISANTTGNTYYVSVDEARFSNNGTGVSFSGNGHVAVTRNDFNMNSLPGTLMEGTGLSLNGCTGYLVEENNFRRRVLSGTFPFVGISVENSGTAANSLYRNSFLRLNKAVQVTGTNGEYHNTVGLECACNTFSGDQYDIYVSAYSDMAQQQGNASVGADNSFTGTTASSFYNAGYRTMDYYHSTGSGYLPYNPTSNVNNRKSLAANPCLSTLCDDGSHTPLPPDPIKSPDAGYLLLKAQYDTLLSVFGSRGYADIVANPSEDLYTPSDIQSARFCLAQLGELERELHARSSTAVRALLRDTLLDLPAVESWFAATPGLSGQYSLAETEYLAGGSNALTLQGVSALLATPEERDEYDNYMAFNALKEALSGHLRGHANWPVATEGQIAELQRIAEAGTGRSSVMARGVLCFFFNICYDDGMQMAETRRAAAKDGGGYMPVLTDDSLSFSIAFMAEIPLKDSDPYYLGARSVLFASGTADTVIFNNNAYRAFKADSFHPLGHYMYLRENTATGQLFRYYPEFNTEVITCDLTLQPGDTFLLPTVQDFTSGSYEWLVYYYEDLQQPCWIVDSVTYEAGRKVVWFPPIIQYDSYLSSQYLYRPCFIEGVGPAFGPFGHVDHGFSHNLGLLLCVHHNDSLVYMTDSVLGCEQYVVSVPQYSDVSMKLYPNPAGNTLHVEFEGTDNPQGTITVTDLTGVVVLTRECNSPVTQLDVSNLSPGLYVVAFRNGKGVAVRKFVKI